LFPGPAVLKKIHDRKIPVIISSDAHKPSEISMLFKETADLLFGIGFRELRSLTPSGWEMEREFPFSRRRRSQGLR